MKTNIITVNDAIANGTWKWGKTSNDVEFKGIITGLVCGVCVECSKDGKIDYCSIVFTNDLDEIKMPSYTEVTDWNSLGISADLASSNGWRPTGNIVFRGYYNESWDFEERCECYIPVIKG